MKVVYVVLAIVVIMTVALTVFDVRLIDDFTGCTTRSLGPQIVVSWRFWDKTNLINKTVTYLWHNELGTGIAEEQVIAENKTHVQVGHTNGFGNLWSKNVSKNDLINIIYISNGAGVSHP